MKLNMKVFGKVIIAVLFVLLIVWFLRRTSREGATAGANQVARGSTNKMRGPQRGKINF